MNTHILRITCQSQQTMNNSSQALYSELQVQATSLRRVAMKLLVCAAAAALLLLLTASVQAFPQGRVSFTKTTGPMIDFKNCGGLLEREIERGEGLVFSCVCVCACRQC